MAGAIWVTDIKSLKVDSLCKRPEDSSSINPKLLSTRPYKCLICSKKIQTGEWHFHHPTRIRRNKTPSYNTLRSYCSACGVSLYEPSSTQK